ncbi:at-rich interactive domain-containing protein 5 [Quercus suber]|uniref:At-rich interactive domain-containing protein 5 n=1 Tax=Quercus suber TaxID=58331 RepID=A0AAW0LRI2_QUESU
MEDNEKLDQNMAKDSDIDLVDANVEVQLQQQEPQQDDSTVSKENQNPSENGNPDKVVGANEVVEEENKSVELGSSDDQVMVDAAPDDEVMAEDEKIDSDDVKDPVENKSNGVADVKEPVENKSNGAADVKEPVENKSSNGTDGRIEIHLEAPAAPVSAVEYSTPVAQNKNLWLSDVEMSEADEWGTPQDQAAFMKELERFHRENALEFKAPKFYGEPLNCLKYVSDDDCFESGIFVFGVTFITDLLLWRAVIRLGGYELVTASKLWRQVGESFHPPKTCTTVSWTFRIFYEKALLEYEKNKRQTGELQLAGSLPPSARVEKEGGGYQPPGSGRARRDAAARAMQGWHSQRLLGYGEVAEPIIKDKNLNSTLKREKNLKSIGSLKHKTPTGLEHAEKAAIVEADKQLITTVVDVGPPADWVKINVRETKDCFEVYALVPGLLREEVRVQSDPAGRLVITGQPEQLDNPWALHPLKRWLAYLGELIHFRHLLLLACMADSLYVSLLSRDQFEPILNGRLINFQGRNLILGDQGMEV